MIENDNVYCVGDIKQSIYRFRNANPYIFKNKYDNYAVGNKGFKIDLVKNFRSRREVLSNINEVFNLVMDDIIGGAEYHESHQMVYGNTSYIEEGMTDYNYDFQILEYEEDEDKKYSNAEIEIFAIAKDIKEKIESKYQVFNKDDKVLRDITYNDFVILMDRTTDFDLYKKIFEYVGIPLTLYKDDKLNNSDDIYIIKNIIDYIVKINKKEFDTTFKYDYTSIARSYLFELSDQEIFNSFKDNNFTNNIVYETFKDLSNEITSTSITTLLERIIEKTNMYEKLIKVGNIDASMIRISKLFDIASNLSSLGYDIYTFSNYLNELLATDYDMKYSATSTGSNSVKIMTIHKSKGLEYHVCYYSGLYKGFNISDLKDRFLFDNKYGIITPYFKEGINESFIKHVVRYHYLEEEVSEKIRLFYVALTRAKETMILLTPKIEEEINDLDENNTIDITVRRKYRSFSDIMDSVKHNLIKYYKEIKKEDLNLSKQYLYNNKSLNKLETTSTEKFEVIPINIEETTTVTQEHFSKNTHELITKEISNNMKFGLKVHETLEYLDFKNPQLDLIEDTFIRNKVEKFLSNPLLSNLKNANIFKEYEFIYNNDNKEYHGIIDLMIEYEDKIDIIDYKLSNIKDENYLKQLNGYKDYISTISNKEINIYLYSVIGETIEKL
jgi:ATP-dependent helicase/nuclease subunit A